MAAGTVPSAPPGRPPAGFQHIPATAAAAWSPPSLEGGAGPGRAGGGASGQGAGRGPRRSGAGREDLPGWLRATPAAALGKSFSHDAHWAPPGRWVWQENVTAAAANENEAGAPLRQGQPMKSENRFLAGERGRACRSRSGWAPARRGGPNRGHGCCAFVGGPERPWELCAFPDCCGFPADGVLQCSLAQRHLRRAPGEGAKSRIEMNVQSEFWRLPAGASAVAPAAPGYLPRCFQSRGGARRMPGITPSSGGLPARRAGWVELLGEMLAETPVLLGLRSGSRKIAKGRPKTAKGRPPRRVRSGSRMRSTPEFRCDLAGPSCASENAAVVHSGSGV